MVYHIPYHIRDIDEALPKHLNISLLDSAICCLLPLLFYCVLSFARSSSISALISAIISLPPAAAAAAANVGHRNKTRGELLSGCGWCFLHTYLYSSAWFLFPIFPFQSFKFDPDHSSRWEAMNFRAASEDDAVAIEMLINDFYDFECVKSSAEGSTSSSSFAVSTRGTPYRPLGPRITKDEIESNIVEEDTNWIVLEDMDADDSDLIGCARMRIDKVKNICYIDLFAHHITEDESENVVHRIKTLLVKHLEMVAMNLGVCVMCYEVPQYNEDMQTFLVQCGYKDTRGRAMNSAETEKMKPILPCILLSYEKRLVTKVSSTKDDEDDEILEVGLLEGSTVFGKASPGPLFEGLMSDLFGALRTEYHDEKSNSTED